MNATRLTALIAAGMVSVALVAGAGSHAALAAPHTTTIVTPEDVTMVIVPGVRLGSDEKLHDAFTPTDFTARAGQEVVVTVYNYDTGTHSFTAPALGLNVVFPAAPRNGVPAVKTFRFTVEKAGSYQWLCVLPCDSDAKGWAMSHQAYMAGTVTIEKA